MDPEQANKCLLATIFMYLTLVWDGEDGYFPIAIYSQLITTSLEGTKPEEQRKANFNDDDFFFFSWVDTQKKMILSRMTLN